MLGDHGTSPSFAVQPPKKPTPDSGTCTRNSGQYTYDALGNIVAIGGDTYSCDANNRLVGATIRWPDGTQMFSRTYTYHLRQSQRDERRRPQRDHQGLLYPLKSSVFRAMFAEAKAYAASSAVTGALLTLDAAIVQGFVVEFHSMANGECQ